MRIDTRWGSGGVERYRRYATELVAFEPDVILVGGAATGPLQQVTRKVPIVFAGVVDPVGAGFVESLARPGGNTTGFTLRTWASSSATDLEVMRRLDRLHLEFPFAGSRMSRGLLAAEGCKSAAGSQKRMGIEALYRRPSTTKAAPRAVVACNRSQWKRRSASRHWRMLWLVTASRTSSTRARARSSRHRSARVQSCAR